ncbi:hypothetical protein B0H10DRAFT_2231118 [Mycena sp. CBHHK59/15]|nr:hypothetical protein B0H10DRAFT_2231118 [Mycena sp. CBHHK59/15]
MSGCKNLPKLAQITWATDEGALTWILLEKLQKKENFVVLFGKQDPKENTSGDRKMTVYERIAQEMFPEEYKDHSMIILLILSPEMVMEQISDGRSLAT